MGEEQDDIREKIRLAIEEAKRAMEHSEQMMVDAKKVRADVKAGGERKVPKADEEGAKG